MDPETARAIAQISADATRSGAVIGLAGAFLVGVLSQIGQYFLAGRNARLQRLHTREQEWRSELARRAASIVAIADSRMGLYKRAVIEASAPGANPSDTQRLWLDTVHGEDDVFKTTAYLGIPDREFHTTVQDFMIADRQTRHSVQRMIEDMKDRWSDKDLRDKAIFQVQHDALDGLNLTVWNLHQAANRVVYSEKLALPGH